MKDLKDTLSSIKKYYIKSSIEHKGNEDMEKAVQSIGIALLFFENSIDEKYVIRDCRNLIYDMTKELSNKESKKLLKILLKIVK